MRRFRLLFIVALALSGCLSEAERRPKTPDPLASDSGKTITPDSAYSLACLMETDGKTAEAIDLLKRALASDQPFKNRADAKKFLRDLERP